MKLRTRATVAVATLAVALAGSIIQGDVASAATPPYEPDPSSVASLTFYDSSGNIITTGNVNDAPFATYIQASAAVRAGDTKATLFGYLPKSGQAPGQFSGEGLSASTDFPNAAAPAPLAASPLPLVTLTADDVTLAGLAGDLPNPAGAGDPYQGLYQLRIKTSAAGFGVTATYASATIRITGGTWQLVYPDPVAQPTSVVVTADPTSPQVAGTAVTLTATVTPANATGTIQFTDGAANIGAPVTVAGGTAQTTASGLGSGTHAFTGVFTPQNPASNPTAFAGSTSLPVSYQLTTPSSSTALSVDTGTGQALSNVTFTATVNPSTAAGTVTFKDGGTTVGTTVPGSGTFQLTTATLGEGAHSITATFNPTDLAAYSTATSAPLSFSLTAPAYAPAVGNIQAEIAAGTIVLSTPYSLASPLDLGVLHLNPSGTAFTNDAATLSGVTITDTRAGSLPWTVSASASVLDNGAGGQISGQNVGLTGVTVDPVAGNALTAANVVTSNNPAAAAVAVSDPGGAGLGGAAPHQVLHADHGSGSVSFHGSVTLNAPTSSPVGTYRGTITFTVL